MNQNHMIPRHNKPSHQPYESGKHGGGEMINIWKEADNTLARERRNVERVRNYALPVGQRSCLSGFYAPKHYWTSRLQEMMEEYDRTHDMTGRYTQHTDV